METTTSALVQSSNIAPAVAQNDTDGRLLFAFTVVQNGQRDIWGRLMLANGTAVGNAFVISSSTLDEFSPSVTGRNGKFLVSFTRSFGSTDTDPITVVVDSATGTVGTRIGLDSSGGTLHTDARCAIVSATSFHCIYRSATELIAMDVASNGAISNRQVIATREDLRSPALAFSPAAGRFMVAWNNSRAEDIEIATRQNGSNVWEVPSSTTWPREACTTNRCINSGDNVSLAWNPTTSKFGVAISNDLSVAGRVEAFILPDTCSASSCAAIRSRVCASSTGCTETFRLAEKASLGDVAVAPADRNFVIAFVFDDHFSSESSISTVGMSETGLRLQTTALSVQPSPVRNPLIMNGSFAGAGTQAVLAYRLTFDSGSNTPVKLARVSNQGAVNAVWEVAP